MPKKKTRALDATKRHMKPQQRRAAESESREVLDDLLGESFEGVTIRLKIPASGILKV